MTVPNSLFSKMMITICEKFGTSGRGVGVGKIVGVGSGVSVRMGKGARVGSDCVGADSVKAGWQAEVSKEALIVIKIMYLRSRMKFPFIGTRINVLKPQYGYYNVFATIQLSINGRWIP